MNHALLVTEVSVIIAISCITFRRRDYIHKKKIEKYKSINQYMKKLIEKYNSEV